MGGRERPRLERADDADLEQRGAQAAGLCVAGDARLCHVELGRHGDVVDCAYGVRVCGDEGRWEPCYPDPSLAPRSVLVAGLEAHALGLAPQGAATSRCINNPCDLGCQAAGEAPDGGVTSAPTGETVWLDAWSGGPLSQSNLPPSYQSKGSLSSKCVVPCEATSCLEACQFDQHCVATQCVAFAPLEGAACHGVDITTATPCVTAAGLYGVTVCNRGDVEAPAGIACHVLPGSSPKFPNASPDVSQGFVAATTKKPLAGGRCETVFVPEAALPGGVASLVCNPAGVAPPGGGPPIVECNPYNNWGAVKGNPTPPACVPMSYGTSSLAPFAVTRVYEAGCPPATLPRWTFFGYVATTPTGTRVELRLRAFARDAAGACAPLPAALADDPAPIAVASVDGSPQSCPVVGGVAGCPLDLFAYLGGDPAASLPCVQLDALGVPAGEAAPTLYSWGVMATCLDAE